MVDEEHTSMTEESVLARIEESIEGMDKRIQSLENEVRALQTKLAQVEKATS